MESDIALLDDQLTSAENEMRSLVDGLTEEQGTTSPAEGSWSVASCLEHLANTNHAYLAVMHPVAAAARAKGKRRRGPAKPGLIGRWFVVLLEPPVKPTRRIKSPVIIQPRAGIGLREASTRFIESQHEIRAFVHSNADLDLAGVTFPNPFVPGLRFSLATGVCNLLAHERRHLWQARQVLLTFGQRGK